MFLKKRHTEKTLDGNKYNNSNNINLNRNRKL